jgi:DNA replication initiation complex subunit (GINS family)
MNDIVERLRRTLSDLPGNDDDLFNEIHAQREEAADEIERLHAEKRQLRKALGKITTLHWFAVPAEIARAALGEEKK